MSDGIAWRETHDIMIPGCFGGGASVAGSSYDLSMGWHNIMQFRVSDRI